MDYRPWDIVIIPYPYQERPGEKQRPSLVLSGESYHEQTGAFIGAMITTATATRWDLDVAIDHLETTNLISASVVRPKLFTLDTALIKRKIGDLHPADVERVRAVLRHHLAL